MDLNVCSRRVHDGYATIRSRGRARPRALYRSDSEELLKEGGGPYALPRLSNFPLAPTDPRQPARWSDFANDCYLIENYATLRGGCGTIASSSSSSSVAARRMVEEQQRRMVTLNTFSRGVEGGRDGNHRSSTRAGNDSRITFDSFRSCNNNDSSDSSVDSLLPRRASSGGGESLANGCPELERKAGVEGARLEAARRTEVERKEGRAMGERDGGRRERRQQQQQQPIYAVPNILSRTRRDRRVAVVDGNYVASGDLYRTTAKYIEDINKNIAEIDKSYDELKKSSCPDAVNNPAYGVINSKIVSKGELEGSCNLYGYPRKRDMAPMPPISSDFGESLGEKQGEEEEEEDVDPRNVDERREIGTVSDNCFVLKGRPNSSGKLPPKLLPRSSSIENNTSRHSTGSTTTTTSSSSTKSSESLYAISEALTAGSSNPLDLGDKQGREEGSDGIDESKDESTSSTDDDRPAIARSVDRSPPPASVTGPIRRNRSRVDCAGGGTRRERDDRTVSVLKYDGVRRGMNGGSLTEKNFHDSRNFWERNNGHAGRRYDTLPSRRSRVASRPLHKSSEDVLDGERLIRARSSSLRRPCASDIDVSLRNDAETCLSIDNKDIDRVKFENSCNGCPPLPFYLMDATDVILHGRKFHSRQQDRFSRLFHGRTRHNSLESEEAEDKDEDNEDNNCRRNGFATLPRRGGGGNMSKDQPSNDPLRRLSGNVPILEPLYEHAVSDPVKPRSTENVIPWWELATRKYRHRSCPSLQAHVVSAFEQSLSNMTQRLQQLTATAEKKDSELQELRETIERLRKQSAEASLNNGTTTGANNGRRHTLGDSDSGTTGCTGNNNHQGASMARQLSADSVTSLNSLSSACSASSHHKKKGWLRSSFSKAFSRSRKNRHGSVSDAEDCKENASGDLSAPNSPRLPSASKHESSRGGQNGRSNGQKSPEVENPLTGSKSSSALYKKEDEDVVELKKQLREKDLVLTDIRLEALSSAHQLESLKDTVIKMRNEMLNLKQNNERLQRLVTSKSLTSSQSSLPSDPDRRFSMTEVASTVAALSNGDTSTTADQLEDLNVPEHSVVPSTTSTTGEPTLEQDTDGKRINVAIYLGSEKNFNYNLVTGSTSDGSIGEPPHCIIANVCISNKTTWDSLDSTVRRCFKEYVSRVDPVTNLGLGVECVAAYHLGEASRCTTDSQHPELLPCGYLIGHVKTIYLVLSGYSWLAVDTLIPRSIVQRLISLLTEHRRVILCGPSGTGKSYLAGKLAHALVDADNDTKDATAVATFNVDHKSSKELRQYLAHIAERCDSNAADELPRVIILENLQHAASLGELFSGLLGTRHSSCPAIIGTMSQATCSTTNLQLHHNFRWVLCANHMEPVKGFLGRYLRRKLLEHELRECGGTRNAEMAAVVEWLPRVWLHLNKFLESHSSSDVTIGPRLFLSCPMEVTGSQVWFTDLWNYSIVPYLVEAVREGLTLYGRRVSGNGNGDSSWEDPAQFITSSYPWISTHAVHGGSDALLRLRPEDVGYDVVTSGHTSGVGASSVKSLGSTHSDTEGDPLLNMLMRLQEAANYSSPHSNDSDSVTSLDSSHTRHSEDLSSSTSSSRGVESAL